MPASGGDPVSTCLRVAFASGSSSTDLDKDLEASAKRVLFSRIDYEPASNYQNNVLNALKSKYIVITPKNSVDSNHVNTTNSTKLTNGINGARKVETLPVPKVTLFPSERVQLGYRDTVLVGSGMINLGYTCFLNATLQALFHVPALVNWLLSETSHQKCEQNSDYQMHPDDICCAVIKTFKFSQSKSGSAMRPICVFSKLKVICKHFNDRSEEDAHEFMRYLLESLEKNYLNRFQGSKLDSYSKETTPINQIFGGYIRSEVVCLSCNAVSTTFQHFQDLPLDIRKVSTLDDALAGYFERERLSDGGDIYKCEKCDRYVPATKKFSIEKPPNVLCVQLKRFSSVNGKITKQVQLPQHLDLTRFISTGVQHKNLVKYRLVSLVTHTGPCANYGHYTAIALAGNGSYYQFDDDSVRPIDLDSVLNMSAYLILYEMEKPFVLATARPSTVTLTNTNQPVRTATPNTNQPVRTATPNTNQPMRTATPKPTHVQQLKHSPLKREGNSTQPRLVKVYTPPNQKVLPTPPPTTVNTAKTKQPPGMDECVGNREEQRTRKSLVPYESDESLDQEPQDNNNNQTKTELEKLLMNEKKNRLKLSSTEKGWSVEQVDNNGTKCLAERNNSWLVTCDIKKKKKKYKQQTTIDKYIVKLTNHDDDDDNNNKTDAGVKTKVIDVSKWSCDSRPTAESNGHSKETSRNGDVVRNLMQSSYQGYGSNNVKNWSGNDSTLSREIQSDREENRKRTNDDVYNDDFDRGKAKKIKYDYSRDRNRPRYNLFQEQANAKHNYWRQNKNDYFNRYNNNYRYNNNQSNWKTNRRYGKNKFGFKQHNRFNNNRY